MRHFCKIENCNKEISKWNFNYGMGFCRSHAHTGTMNSQFGKKGELSTNWKNGGKKYFCQDCGKEIYFGFKRCKSCARKEQYQNPENHPMYKNGITLINKFCIDCGRKINYQAKKCVYCKSKGINNPNYIDGRSFEEYPQEFNNDLKSKIRKRDNYECQNCNMTEEEHLIVFGSVLHVHHIDYNKKNCVPSNLITTCHNCNIRANYNRNYWKDFYNAKIEIINNFKTKVI